MSAAKHHENDHENDEMYSIDEAAAFLRVSVATMRYWRYCGTGPFSFKVGRHVRYWYTDLVLWRADQGRIQSGSSAHLVPKILRNARSAPLAVSAFPQVRATIANTSWHGGRHVTRRGTT